MILLEDSGESRFILAVTLKITGLIPLCSPSPSFSGYWEMNASFSIFQKRESFPLVVFKGEKEEDDASEGVS